MNNKRILVTTAIEDTWGFDKYKEIIFLGEWCKVYSSKSLWQELNHRVVNFFWEDRTKFKKDYNYIEELYENLLSSLTDTLNSYHNTTHSVGYWRIVLGPWLLTYVSAIWSRWEGLRVAFNNNKFDETILLDFSAEYTPPSSHLESMSLISSSHSWNHLVFARILKKYYADKINFIYLPYCEKSFSQEISDYNRKYSLKYKIYSWFDKLAGLIRCDEKVVFVTSYFSAVSLAKIALKLRQLPRFYQEFDQAIEMPNASSSSRSKLILSLNCSGEFETFVKDNLFLDIPIPYLEGYSIILKKSKHLLPNCEVVFSANSYWYNDLFKIWCAEKFNLKKIIIISEHGSSIRPKYKNFSHEEKISDIYTVWHKSLSNRQVRLPPNKIVGTNPIGKYGTNLLVVGLESSLYPARCCSGPVSSLLLNDYFQNMEFINGIDPVIHKYLKVHPHHNSGWSTSQRYIDELSASNISPHSTLLKAFKYSRIIVCTYPETTFFEAMYSGVPTILLYKKEYWEFCSEFDGLVEVLEDANILFDNPLLASNHINKIWNNPKTWWDSKKVINAREEFFDQCGRVDDDWLEQWVNFFKAQLTNLEKIND